eukprot:GHVP01009584.1.p1 GENE.GHVP01009584.1~~GHVP01009584.1.p1  ORF type:complete len:465 (-),score=99.24 GHVP01009584.1:150-1544(-)
MFPEGIMGLWNGRLMDSPRNYSCRIHPKFFCQNSIRLSGESSIINQSSTDQILENCKDQLYTSLLHPIITRQQCIMPQKSTLIHECGKFQILSPLLIKLQQEGHKCIIFTQMSKMLDVIEHFINQHGMTYVRFDGSTKPEKRQRIIRRFNNSPKIFAFIASTRAGGIGINVTGADVVIFYDSDWNPAMDRQAMDRCHRIGQTRNVTIYRLISEQSVEENILRKQFEKRMLDDVVVNQGKFTSLSKDYMAKTDVKDIFKIQASNSDIYKTRILHSNSSEETPLQKKPLSAQEKAEMEEFEAALNRVEDQEDIEALREIEKEASMENEEYRHEFSEVKTETEETPSTPADNASIEDKDHNKEHLNQSRIRIDANKSVYVKPVVELAIHYYENENVPNSVLYERRKARWGLTDEENVGGWDNKIKELEEMEWESEGSSSEDEDPSENGLSDKVDFTETSIIGISTEI